MYCESPILRFQGDVIVTEILSTGLDSIDSAGHEDISIDSAFQWKVPANVCTLTLLVVGYFYSPRVSTAVAN